MGRKFLKILGTDRMWKTKIGLCALLSYLSAHGMSRSMRRRTFLAGVGAPSVGVLAGCLGDGEGMPSGDDDGSDHGDESDVYNGDLTCENTDADAPIDTNGYPGIDEPPQDIESPDEEHGRMADPEYLGHCMATDPTLAFEVLEASDSPSIEKDRESGAYWVGLVTTAQEREEVLDGLFPDIDLGEYVLVVVQSRGSNGNKHRWKRVEETGDGIHLHGYYRQTDTLDDRIIQSILKVERSSEDMEVARVSLTREEDLRYHIDSDVSPVEFDEMRE